MTVETFVGVDNWWSQMRLLDGESYDCWFNHSVVVVAVGLDCQSMM